MDATFFMASSSSEVTPELNFFPKKFERREGVAVPSNWMRSRCKCMLRFYRGKMVVPYNTFFDKFYRQAPHFFSDFPNFIRPLLESRTREEVWYKSQYWEEICEC